MILFAKKQQTEEEGEARAEKPSTNQPDTEVKPTG